MPAAAPEPKTSLMLKVFLAGIVTGDDDAGDSVAGALPEAAAAEGVIAIVLVGDGRNDAFDQEILDGLIGSGMPEVATEGDAARAELGIGIFRRP